VRALTFAWRRRAHYVVPFSTTLLSTFLGRIVAIQQRNVTGVATEMSSSSYTFASCSIQIQILIPSNLHIKWHCRSLARTLRCTRRRRGQRMPTVSGRAEEDTEQISNYSYNFYTLHSWLVTPVRYNIVLATSFL
jgi:hypothetical protein